MRCSYSVLVLQMSYPVMTTLACRRTVAVVYRHLQMGYPVTVIVHRRAVAIVD
jgi:hypothetical protein